MNLTASIDPDPTPDPAPTRTARTAFRFAAVGLASAVLVLTNVGTAQAHVQVLADSPTTGGYSALTFRVPNESATADTVRVSVQLPQDHPFLSVSSKPVPGWRITMTEQPLPKPEEDDGATITKAVRTVTWTADRGTQIADGQYQEFSISAGPLPAPGEVLLPVVQTYSDGSRVTWDQATPASGAEPDHPVPTLHVTAVAAPSTTTQADDTARWLAGGALGLGVVAVALALLSVSRTRRPRTA